MCYKIADKHSVFLTYLYIIDIILEVNISKAN